MDEIQDFREFIAASFQGWQERILYDFSTTISTTVGPHEARYRTFMSKLDAISSLFGALDDTFDELSQAQSELRREHNQRLSINRLPLEILSAVFAEHAQRKPYHGFLRITHVCSYWRTVAIETPALWSRIDLAESPHDVIKLFTERAKTYPLTLLNCRPFHVEFDRDLLRANLYNIRTLEIIGLPFDFSITGHLIDSNTTLEDADATAESILAPPPAGPLTLLEHFSWRVPQSPGSQYIQLPSLFEGGLPALRHVTFAGLSLPLSPSAYHDLHTIQLTDCHPRKCFKTPEDILSVLRACPHLHTFILSMDSRYSHDRFPRFDTEADGFVEPIILPHLRHLSLNLPTDCVNYIIRSVHAECIVELELVYARLEEDSSSVTTPYLPEGPLRSVLSSVGSIDVSLAPHGSWSMRRQDSQLAEYLGAIDLRAYTPARGETEESRVLRLSWYPPNLRNDADEVLPAWNRVLRTFEPLYEAVARSLPQPLQRQVLQLDYQRKQELPAPRGLVLPCETLCLEGIAAFRYVLGLPFPKYDLMSDVSVSNHRHGHRAVESQAAADDHSSVTRPAADDHSSETRPDAIGHPSEPGAAAANDDNDRDGDRYAHVETLVLEHMSLCRADVEGLIEWCKQHESVCELRCNHVTFHDIDRGSHYSYEPTYQPMLERELDELGVEVEWLTTPKWDSILTWFRMLRQNSPK